MFAKFYNFDKLIIGENMIQSKMFKDALKNNYVIPAFNVSNFEIYKGEVFGLVGESGCGKTTTGRSIIRLYDITGGSVYYKGERICAGIRSYKDAINKAKKDADLGIISKEQLEEMEENVYLAKFHAQKGHYDQLAVLDNRFHEIMYEACNSKMLEHQLKDFHDYVLRVRKKTLANVNRGTKSNEEHEQIMEAIRAIRNRRAEMNVPPSKKAKMFVVTKYEDTFQGVPLFFKANGIFRKATESEGVLKFCKVKKFTG